MMRVFETALVIEGLGCYHFNVSTIREEKKMRLILMCLIGSEGNDGLWEGH